MNLFRFSSKHCGDSFELFTLMRDAWVVITHRTRRTYSGTGTTTHTEIWVDLNTALSTLEQ